MMMKSSSLSVQHGCVNENAHRSWGGAINYGAREWWYSTVGLYSGKGVYRGFVASVSRRSVVVRRQ